MFVVSSIFSGRNRASGKNLQNWLAGVAVSAALVAASFSSPAKSADLGLESAPEPLPLHDWSGFYLGIAGGWYEGRAKGPYELEILEPGEEPLLLSGGSNNKPNRGMFGGYGGYNWQMPDSGIVLGIEADIYAVGGKDTSGLASSAEIDSTAIDLSISNQDKVTATWAVRGRLGWAIDNFMPYIAGGFAGASMKSALAISAFDTESEELVVDDSVSSKNSYSGWTIGGGMEWMVTENWKLRIDYQHKDLGTKNTNAISGSFEGIGYSAKSRTKLTSDQVTFGAGFNF